MRYSDDVIQRVKDATDIVAVIGEHVPLKKAGSSYKGLCPFHQEKTPSFMVSPSRSSFHCFGCGKGGNVITFLMEVEKISFPEALKLLADKAGVILPKPEQKDEDKTEERLRERLYELNEFAARFFSEKLLSTEGQEAREYFKKRGFAKETAMKYQIGFAPSGWDALKIAAQKAGFSQEELLAGGLIVHNEEKKSFYDKFRNRLIFPVKNTYDKITAFGGRTLSEESGPKYLNSPETLLFRKSETLYLLNEAREAIRKKDCVLVVEGYFDALALHCYGFENAVATLGTALTSQHGRMLQRYTKDVILLYDSDDAGQAAVARGFEPLLQAGLKVRVLVLPDAKDPDEYLRKHPKEELEELIVQAPDFFRWWATSLKKKLKGKLVEERLRATGVFIPLLLQMPDEVSVLAACAAIESELLLDARSLVDIVNAARKKGVRYPVRATETAKIRDGEGASSLGQKGDIQAEADFLALLTEENGAFVPWALGELKPEIFHGENFRQLFGKLQTGEMQVQEMNRAPELAPSFMRIEAETQPRMREAMLVDLAKRLKKKHLKQQMEELDIEKNEAIKSGDQEKAMQLAQQIYLLKKRFEEVETK